MAAEHPGKVTKKWAADYLTHTAEQLVFDHHLKTLFGKAFMVNYEQLAIVSQMLPPPRFVARWEEQLTAMRGHPIQPPTGCIQMVVKLLHYHFSEAKQQLMPSSLRIYWPPVCEVTGRLDRLFIKLELVYQDFGPVKKHPLYRTITTLDNPEPEQHSHRLFTTTRKRLQAPRGEE